MSRRLMIPLLRNLIREWSRVSHMFSTSRPRCDWELWRVESPLLQGSTAGQLELGPSGSQTLIWRSNGKNPYIHNTALDIVFPIPMCDTGLSGGGPALQLTVHSTHQPPSVQLACTVHTLPSWRGNWKLVNTSDPGSQLIVVRLNSDKKTIT